MDRCPRCDVPVAVVCVFCAMPVDELGPPAPEVEKVGLAAILNGIG